MQLGSNDPRSRITDGSTDRAVSPVIGVILMVAITVVLAGVIGVMVFGLTDDLGDTAPSNSLDISGDIDTNGEFNVTVAHANGDSVNTDDIELVIRDSDGSTLESYDASDIGSLNSGDDFGVGDSFTHSATGTAPSGSAGEVAEFEIIHNPSDSIIGSAEIEIESP